MLALLDQVKEPFIANDTEAVIAREAVARLKPIAETETDVRLRVADKGADVIVPLPARALMLIVEVLTTMAEQKAVSFIPHSAELTTQQSADFLNVSRPFLVSLIERGELPHRKVGTHRRVLVADLIAYKDRSMVKRREAIVSVVDEAQRLRLP